MKKLMLIAIALVGLAACSYNDDNNDANPMAPAEPAVEDIQTQDAKKSAQSTEDDQKAPQATAPFSLDQSYLGKNLTMIYPHSANWGWVKIMGQDAEKLFETLQVKVTEAAGNSMWLPAQVKEGGNIACYKQAMKATPEKMKYTCSIYIDYRKGLVSVISAEIAKDKSVPELEEPYSGETLELKAPDVRDWGRVRLSGKDAEALYFTMAVEPFSAGGNAVYLPAKQKKGVNINCFEQAAKATPDKPEYVCSLFLNYSTGEINTIR